MSEVTVALFSALAALLIGIFNVFLTVSKIKIDGVTQHRVEWLQEVRALSTQILSFNTNIESNYEERMSLFNQLKEKAYRLALYLNPLGPFDRIICRYLADYIKSLELEIDTADSNQDNSEVMGNRKFLDLSIRIYLKAEWDRVKWENKIFRRFTYSQKKEEKAINSILHFFNSEDIYVGVIAAHYSIERLQNSYHFASPFFFPDLMNLSTGKISTSVVSEATNSVKVDSKNKA